MKCDDFLKCEFNSRGPPSPFAGDVSGQLSSLSASGFHVRAMQEITPVWLAGMSGGGNPFSFFWDTCIQTQAECSTLWGGR